MKIEFYQDKYERLYIKLENNKIFYTYGRCDISFIIPITTLPDDVTPAPNHVYDNFKNMLKYYIDKFSNFPKDQWVAPFFINKNGDIMNRNLIIGNLDFPRWYSITGSPLPKEKDDYPEEKARNLFTILINSLDVAKEIYSQF